MELETAKQILKELKELEETLLFKLWTEFVQDEKLASQALANDVPDGIKGLVLREQGIGAHRAFKQIEAFFGSLKTELKKRIKENE